MKRQLILTWTTASLLAAGSSHAAITLVDFVGFGNTTGSTEDTDGNDNTRTVGAGELGTLNTSITNAGGVDKLVITLGGEGSSNDVTSVTYGGTPMFEIIDSNNGSRDNSIWYVDNITSTGEFVITYGSGAGTQTGLGFAAYALNGTVDGTAASTSVTSANSGTATYLSQIEITTTLPGEFLVASFVRNNFDNVNNDNPGTEIQGTGVASPLLQSYYAGTDSSSAAGAYQEVTSPSTLTPLIFDLTNGTGTVMAATFQPAVIPEPGSLALMGLGGLLIARRRR